MFFCQNYIFHQFFKTRLCSGVSPKLSNKPTSALLCAIPLNLCTNLFLISAFCLIFAEMPSLILLRIYPLNQFEIPLNLCRNLFSFYYLLFFTPSVFWLFFKFTYLKYWLSIFYTFISFRLIEERRLFFLVAENGCTHAYPPPVEPLCVGFWRRVGVNTVFNAFIFFIFFSFFFYFL